MLFFYMRGQPKMASSSLVCSGEATKLFEAAFLESETIAVYFVKMLMDPGEFNCYPANNSDFQCPVMNLTFVIKKNDFIISFFSMRI